MAINVLAKKNLASVYTNQGRFEQAVALYQEILKDTPFDAVVFKSLGQICLKIGNTEQAREFLTITLQRNPEDEQARKLLEAVDALTEAAAVK